MLALRLPAAIAAIRKSAARLSAAAALGLFAAIAGHAQPAGAVTVQEILQRGSVKIGVLTGAPPFGTIDEHGNPSGYDVDVANLVGGYLGVKVTLVPLTPPARIPALESGKVDFLVATLAPTPERARTVMFTLPYSAFQMVICAPDGTALSNVGDLKGKRVGVNRGSSQEAALVKAAVPGTEIVRYEDDSTVAQALFAGQIDAAALPSTVAAEVKKQRPDAGFSAKFVFFNQANAMAVKLSDFELRQWLNTAIYSMKIGGELDRISQKWTGSALPALPVF